MISQAGNFTLLFQKYSKPYISLLLTSACVKQKKTMAAVCGPQNILPPIM